MNVSLTKRSSDPGLRFTLAWTPITRDGGARLGRYYNLYDMTQARDTSWFNDGFGRMVE